MATRALRHVLQESARPAPAPHEATILTLPKNRQAEIALQVQQSADRLGIQGLQREQYIRQSLMLAFSPKAKTAGNAPGQAQQRTDRTSPALPPQAAVQEKGGVDGMFSSAFAHIDPRAQKVRYGF